MNFAIVYGDKISPILWCPPLEAPETERQPLDPSVATMTFYGPHYNKQRSGNYMVKWLFGGTLRRYVSWVDDRWSTLQAAGRLAGRLAGIWLALL
jgi:hypothetical protein